MPLAIIEENILKRDTDNSHKSAEPHLSKSKASKIYEIDQNPYTHESKTPHIYNQKAKDLINYQNGYG
jgi:hypothetical protein